VISMTTVLQINPTPAQASALVSNQWTSSNVPAFSPFASVLQPVLAFAGVCAPLGEPINGSAYRGSNAFYLCKEGERYNNVGHRGNTVELFIACRESSARPGTHWHIWCTTNGVNCGCNKNDFDGGESSGGGWSAGDHCQLQGASPGANGCAPPW
jgi:hypothetical protein